MTDESTIDNPTGLTWPWVYQTYFETMIVPDNGWRSVLWETAWLAVLIVIHVNVNFAPANLWLAIMIGLSGASLVSYLVHLGLAMRGWRPEG